MAKRLTREDLQKFLDAQKKGPEAVAELLRQKEQEHRERKAEIAKLPERVEQTGSTTPQWGAATEIYDPSEKE